MCRDVYVYIVFELQKTAVRLQITLTLEKTDKDEFNEGMFTITIVFFPAGS